MESRFDRRRVKNEKKAIVYRVPDFSVDKKFFISAYKRGDLGKSPRFFYLFQSEGRERGSNTGSGIQENKYIKNSDFISKKQFCDS